MRVIFSDDEQGQDHIHGEYKGFLLVDTRYVWGHEVVAIPDHGETLRLKMIGYTKTERLQAIKNLINEGVTK
jgi:hypothetical protein